MKRKTIIIPDVHNKWKKAEKIIEQHGWEKNYEVEKIVFLGDYFDSFNDTPEAAAETAEWLKQSLSKEKRIHLFGNHDISYAFPKNVNLFCPGWSPQKNREVWRILSEDDFSKIKTHEILRDDPPPLSSPVVLSHAGFTLGTIYGFFRSELARFHKKDSLPTEFHIESLEKAMAEWARVSKKGFWHPFSEQGTRVGRDCQGGPFWLDWSDFTPMEGIRQVVGHTPGKKPRWHSGGQETLCIDTYLDFYAEYCSGSLGVFSSVDG